MSQETHDGKSPSLDAVANAAGLSKFHFNRVYKLATGETPQQTLTRFKLVRGADQLRDPDVSIIDAAFSAGYGSSQAFAKALKRVLSASASEIRYDQEQLSAAIETLVIPQTGEKNDISIEIARIEPFEAIALRTDGTYPSLNETFWALFEAAGDPTNVQAILGQPYGDIDADVESTLRFDCSLKLTERLKSLPEGIERTKISGGAKLLTRHLGSYDLLPDAIDRLYMAAMSIEEAQVADEPLLFHYLDDPETTAEEQLRTDIYLPLNV
ncbi:MAG: GyrI-like domain-containing protein [Pseudomonadota bacterium]